MGKVLFFQILLAIGISQIANAQSSFISSGVPGQKINADLIVVKLKTPTSSNGRVSTSHESQLEKLKDVIDYADHYQVFAKKSFSNARLSSSGLQNIYKIKLKPGSNIWRELAILQQLDFIEYAEPFFQNELLFIPNDPQANPTNGQQDYLSVIKAYEGWQIDQSDSSIVIGIVDTGVKMNHEDLKNIAFNHADSINGIDDDDDGYIDNYFGWDVANKDNDPTSDTHPHGSAVTGLSSATTNNGIGMAGIGFNSKYLPVKIADTNTKNLMNEYEGIVYAAEHGCSVINLSWGGVENSSKYGQDIINYVVLEKDVVVVAAAGNTHDELNFYPASYENVLSVGATDINDKLASWATYSHFIDITAPGHNVYSTKNNGGYERTTGTSFSSPLAAGAAALVRSRFPELSAQQVMEQLRVTSDDIYSVGSNMDFYGQMGRGRLNIQRALSDILTPAIRLNEFHYQSNHGDLIFPGDTINMLLKFTNYLRNAENINITISNPSTNVSLEMDHFYIDKLGEYESFENLGDPVNFIVNSDVIPGESLLFRIDYVGNYYTDFQYIEINATPEYFDMSDGKLTSTISSDGDIGFDGPFFKKGSGVSYKDDFLANQTGLIISLDSNHVIDNVVNNFDTHARDEDFVQETNARLYDNSLADYDARSAFKPRDTITTALDIKIEQKILTWENNTNDGYIIFEYRIINSGDSTLTGLNAGLFADWNLGDYDTNEAAWDDDNNFGYVFDKSSGELYAGMALLTNQTFSYYAIDKESRHGNAADVDFLLMDKMKHEFLSSTSSKASAGTQGEGNDVAHIVGGRNINLEPNQSMKVSFAMLASTSLEGLRSALSLARAKYADYLIDPPLAETYYACTGDSALIDPIGEVYEFYADVAITQKLDSGILYKTKPVIIDQVYYAVNLDSGYASDVMKILVQPGNPTADFIMTADTLLIESGKSNSMDIDNTSILSDQWLWDFGNGYGSIIEDPQTIYNTPGDYAIKLIANNNLGCADTTIQSLMVIQRSDKATVEDQQICKGTSAIISASNTDKIKVYKENDLVEVLFEGAEFITNAINADTSFYVVNTNGDFESVAEEIKIIVKYPRTGFEHQIDTLNLEEKYVLNVKDINVGTDSIFWLVNEQFKSAEATFSFAYTDEPFDISQIKVDEDGCTDTLIVAISPQYSDIPELEDVKICKNSSAFIRPGNGELFYFYEDMSLSNLLHKGKSWFISNINESKEYFVTNVDGLLEGASASMEVTLDPIQAIIETSADTIDLVDENQVELRNNSKNSTNSFWQLSQGTIDTREVLIETYDVPGIYDYTLIAEGNNGCIDTAYHKIHVVRITGLDDQNFEKMSFYPNPVNDFLTIDFGKNMDKEIEFELVDTSGKRIKYFTINVENASYQLSLVSLKKGIYFIRSLNAPNPVTAKIIKQ